MVKTTHDNIRTQCLLDAIELINGDRNKDYGEPMENHQRIADGWSVILRKSVAPHEVALCMAWLKIARLVNTPHHQDSYTDGAAYIALAQELAERGKSGR